MRFTSRIAAALLLLGLGAAAHAQEFIKCAPGVACNGSNPVNTGSGDPLPTAGAEINFDVSTLWSVLQPSLSGAVSTPGNSNTTTLNPHVVDISNMGPMPGLTIVCNPTGVDRRSHRLHAGPRWPRLSASVAVGGSGTVQTVSLTGPSILAITGSGCTVTCTLGITLANESANAGFIGPTSGGVGTPTFRSMVTADLPTTAVSPGSYTMPISPSTPRGALRRRATARRAAARCR